MAALLRARCDFVLLVVALTVCGCQPTTILPGSTNSGSGATSTTSTPTTSTTSNPNASYADEVRELTRLCREVQSLYGQSLNTTDEQRQQLLAPIRTALKGSEDCMIRLGKRPNPTPEEAEALKAAEIADLEAAIKELRAMALRHSERKATDGFIESSGLYDAMSNAQSIVQHALKSIAPPPNSTSEAEQQPVMTDSGFLPPGQGQTDSKSSSNSSSPAQSGAGLYSEAVEWSVEPDPAPVESLFDPAKPFKIKVPGVPAKYPHAFTSTPMSEYTQMVTVMPDISLLYPHVVSPLVLVGWNNSRRDTSEIWNMQTGQKVASIKGLELPGERHATLSADGKYFAAHPMHEKLIGVWNVEEGKPLGVLPIEDWSGLGFLGFGVDNRLVWVDDDTIKVAEMPSGNVVATHEPGSWARFDAVALSSGGRYLAYLDYLSERGTRGDMAIFLFDIQAGRVAGQIPIAERSLTPGYLLFSRDGQRLLQFSLLGLKLTISEYDLEDGDLVNTYQPTFDLQTVQHETTFYSGPVWRELPGTNVLLFRGSILVDLETGETLEPVPERTVYQVFPLSGDTLAVMDSNNLVPWTVPQLKARLEQ